jgi:acetyl esterase/lipase
MKYVAMLIASAATLAAQPPAVPLYPGVAPGSETWTHVESEAVGPKDDLRRVSNVVKPVLIPYLAPADKANGTAMIICPGGGFRILAVDHEGHEVARYLNSLGVTAFVLKYRVAQTGDEASKDAAVAAARRKTAMAMGVADGEEAVRMVRRRAAEWKINPHRVGIMGFSAGGYVTVGVTLTGDASARPDFSAPIYAAMPPELAVTAAAPPLFLVHADDDPTVLPAATSVRLYNAYKNAKLSAELHIYSKGSHGFGMRKKTLPVDSWTDRLRDWLDVQGLLKPVK